MKNLKLEKFKKDIKGKKVAVIGVGISNIPAIKYLVSLGAIVTAHDKNEKLAQKYEDFKKLGISFVLGQDYLKGLNNYDYILRSPGIRPFYPEIEEAVKSGVKITSEIELLIENAPCKVIGVTGSDGKTTTTTLISKFLEEAGYKVWLGGNIGIPLFSKLDEIEKEDIVVVELSSFQLMTMKVSPNISIITNISPNHLDYHRSFDEYIDAKSNIFLHQNKGDLLVLNCDNEYTKRYLGYVKDNNIKSDIRYFSVMDHANPGTFLEDGYVVSNINGVEQKIVKISDVKLVGIHNLSNICAATSAVLHITGVEPIQKVVTTFMGVEHRMEMFRILKGVKWYNDSIGTSPTRTIAGLTSFNQKVILIAGGYDKHIPYDVMGSYIIDKVKTLILVGKTAPKIEKAVLDEVKKQGLNENEYCDIHNFTSLEECVNYAYSIAKNGDCVVLSPASASFDLYKNFEERGDLFKSLVNKLS